MPEGEGLGRKKTIRGGHRASVTRLITEVERVLGVSPAEDGKVPQLKLSLSEKLNTLKQLDAEILHGAHSRRPARGRDREGR